MLTRRFALTAIAASAAAPALAQGKKSTGKADDGPLPGAVAGRYTAFGRNPDGSSYEGRCDVIQQGSIVEFAWTIDGDSTAGDGVVEGRVVTVDWGDDTPVVYVIMPDGELHGTWADGTALEKLTRA